MIDRLRRIKELIRHKIAFAKIEKKLYGNLSIRSFTHDLDKLLFYFIPVSVEWNRKRHKRTARHHNPENVLDYREQFIDWECARYTKSKSIMTGIEWCHKKYTLGKTSESDYEMQQIIIEELKPKLGL